MRTVRLWPYALGSILFDFSAIAMLVAVARFIEEPLSVFQIIMVCMGHSILRALFVIILILIWMVKEYLQFKKEYIALRNQGPAQTGP